MQGTVWANLCCTVLMDKLGKILYKQPELMYKYKGTILVPSLQMVDDIMVLGKCSSLQTVQSNSVVNSFMHTKKLTLSEKKSHTVHIGMSNSSKECSTLKVQGTQMRKEPTAKYLGDHVNTTGSVKATIDERRGKAFGISAEVLSIANSVPLGQWRVKSGIMLRQAMLVNGILFNSECWQGPNVNKDIMTLNKPDQALLRGLMTGHAKAPLEFLFLESGCVPVSFIHICRRLVYLQNILKKDRSELVSRVYFAQKADSLPGDFCRLVAEDLVSLDISLTEDQIRIMSTTEYKKHIKEKVRSGALRYLQSVQETHSKVRNIKYSKFEMQPYLCSALFSKENIGMLFSLRSRTVRTIRNDFQEQYKPNLSCPLCSSHIDSLPEILNCVKLKYEIQGLPDEIQASINQTSYEDIFSTIDKQKQATETYTILLKIREKLLDSNPLHISG